MRFVKTSIAARCAAVRAGSASRDRRPAIPSRYGWYDGLRGGSAPGANGADEAMTARGSQWRPSTCSFDLVPHWSAPSRRLRRMSLWSSARWTTRRGGSGSARCLAPWTRSWSCLGETRNGPLFPRRTDAERNLLRRGPDDSLRARRGFLRVSIFETNGAGTDRPEEDRAGTHRARRSSQTPPPSGRTPPGTPCPLGVDRRPHSY